MGVDLREQLNMVAIGDICTIPGNLEKSFDQISKGIGHVASHGVSSVATIPLPTQPSVGSISTTDAHDTVVPRHKHPQRSSYEPRTDRYRRMASSPGRG